MINKFRNLANFPLRQLPDKGKVQWPIHVLFCFRYQARASIGFIFLLILTGSGLYGQQNSRLLDPQLEFQKAVDVYRHGHYAIAQGQFQKILQQEKPFERTNHTLEIQDAEYYFISCGLKLEQSGSEYLAIKYLGKVNNQARKKMLSYKLAHYLFRQNKLKEAIPYYENSGYSNLSGSEILTKKFELGYCYFNLKEFNKAAPLFKSIKDVNNPYAIPSNYYYGFIEYYKKKYADALSSLQLVKNEPKYSLIVPYYIAEIYYFQDKYNELLAFAKPYAETGHLYYDKQLKHLIGQTYYELHDYSNALPYLETYESTTDRLTKEDVYELAYTYYKLNRFGPAISGFKQLSTENDSLGQNSMYLLGDCYLKTGQKSDAKTAFGICSQNSQNRFQQEISMFTYGKLSAELGFPDAAIQSLETFLQKYPESGYSNEAKTLLAHLFMNTNDYNDAYQYISLVKGTSVEFRQISQKITFGRAMQLINDNQLQEADKLLDQSLENPVNPVFQQLAYFWKGEIALRMHDYRLGASDIEKYFSLGSINSPAALGEANMQTAHYNLGYCYLQQGQYSRALQQFQQAQTPYGNLGSKIASDATLRAADCYFMQKDYSDAYRIYDQITQSNAAGSDYALYQKALIDGIGGHNNEKIRLLRSLKQQYPSSTFNSSADYQIATTMIDNQSYSQAIPYLDQVIQSPGNPDASKALLKKALVYFNLNNVQQAIATYKSVVAQYPNSPESNQALESLKSIYINNGQSDAYIAYLKSIGRSLNSTSKDSLTYASAEASFGNAQYNTAITLFTSYLNQYPNGQFILNAHFYRAESYYNTQQYTNALPDYEFVLAQNTNEFSARSAAQAAQICFSQTRDFSKALTYYSDLQQMANNKEDILRAQRGVLRSAYELNDWSRVKAAAATLLGAENISTDDQIVAHFYEGKSFQNTNNCDSAIIEYTTVANLTKSELGAEARYRIAECQFQNNNLKKAEASAFDAIKNTPSYDYWVADSYILLGEIYFKEKDYFNANATLESIVKNCKIPELVTKAQNDLKAVQAAAKKESKIKN